MPASKRESSPAESQSKMRKVEEDGEDSQSKSGPTYNSPMTGAPRAKKKRSSSAEDDNNTSRQSSPSRDSSATPSDPPLKKAKLLNATSASCGEAPSHGANSKGSLKQTASTESDEERSSDKSKVDFSREREDDDKARCIRKYSNKVKAKRKAEEDSSEPPDTDHDLSPASSDSVQIEHNYGRNSDSASSQSLTDGDKVETSADASDPLVSETGRVCSTAEEIQLLGLESQDDETSLRETVACTVSEGQMQRDTVGSSEISKGIDNETLSSLEETLCSVPGDVNSSCGSENLAARRPESAHSSEGHTHPGHQSLSEEDRCSLSETTEGYQEEPETGLSSGNVNEVSSNEMNSPLTQVENCFQDAQFQGKVAKAESFSVSEELDAAQRHNKPPGTDGGSREDVNKMHENSEEKLEQSSRQSRDLQSPHIGSGPEISPEEKQNHSLIHDPQTNCRDIYEDNQTENLSENIHVPENHRIQEALTKVVSTNVDKEPVVIIKSAVVPKIPDKEDFHASIPSAVVDLQIMELAASPSANFLAGENVKMTESKETLSEAEGQNITEIQTGITSGILNPGPQIETQKQEFQEVRESPTVVSPQIHDHVTVDKCENRESHICFGKFQGQSGMETQAVTASELFEHQPKMQMQENRAGDQTTVPKNPKPAECLATTGERLTEVDKQTSSVSKEVSNKTLTGESHSQKNQPVSEHTTAQNDLESTSSETHKEDTKANKALSEAMSNLAPVEETETQLSNNSTNDGPKKELENANSATLSQTDVVETADSTEDVSNIATVEEIQIPEEAYRGPDGPCTGQANFTVDGLSTAASEEVSNIDLIDGTQPQAIREPTKEIPEEFQKDQDSLKWVAPTQIQVDATLEVSNPAPVEDMGTSEPVSEPAIHDNAHENLEKSNCRIGVYSPAFENHREEEIVAAPQMVSAITVTQTVNEPTTHMSKESQKDLVNASCVPQTPIEVDVTLEELSRIGPVAETQTQAVNTAMVGTSSEHPENAPPGSSDDIGCVFAQIQLETGGEIVSSSPEGLKSQLVSEHATDISSKLQEDLKDASYAAQTQIEATEKSNNVSNFTPIEEMQTLLVSECTIGILDEAHTDLENSHFTITEGEADGEIVETPVEVSVTAPVEEMQSQLVSEPTSGIPDEHQGNVSSKNSLGVQQVYVADQCELQAGGEIVATSQIISNYPPTEEMQTQLVNQPTIPNKAEKDVGGKSFETLNPLEVIAEAAEMQIQLASEATTDMRKETPIDLGNANSAAQTRVEVDATSEKILTIGPLGEVQSQLVCELNGDTADEAGESPETSSPGLDCRYAPAADQIQVQANREVLVRFQKVSSSPKIEEMQTQTVDEPTAEISSNAQKNASCAAPLNSPEEVCNIAHPEEIQIQLFSEPTIPKNAQKDLGEVSYAALTPLEVIAEAAEMQIPLVSEATTDLQKETQIDLENAHSAAQTQVEVGATSEKSSTLVPLEEVQSQLVSEPNVCTLKEARGSPETLTHSLDARYDPASGQSQVQADREVVVRFQKVSDFPPVEEMQTQTVNEPTAEIPSNAHCAAPLDLPKDVCRIAHPEEMQSQKVSEPMQEISAEPLVENNDKVNVEILTVTQRQMEMDAAVTIESSASPSSSDRNKSQVEFDMETPVSAFNIGCVDEAQSLENHHVSIQTAGEISEEVCDDVMNSKDQNVKKEQVGSKECVSVEPKSEMGFSSDNFLAASSEEIQREKSQNELDVLNAPKEMQNQIIQDFKEKNAESEPVTVLPNKMETLPESATKSFAPLSTPETETLQILHGAESTNHTTEGNEEEFKSVEECIDIGGNKVKMEANATQPLVISHPTTGVETKSPKSLDASEPAGNSNLANEEEIAANLMEMEIQTPESLEEIFQPTAYIQTQSQKAQQDVGLSFSLAPNETHNQLGPELTELEKEAKDGANKAAEECAGIENPVEIQTLPLEISPQTETQKSLDLTDPAMDISENVPGRFPTKESVENENQINEECVSIGKSLNEMKIQAIPPPEEIGHENDDGDVGECLRSSEVPEEREMQTTERSDEISQLIFTEQKPTLKGQEITEANADTDISVSLLPLETQIQKSRDVCIENDNKAVGEMLSVYEIETEMQMKNSELPEEISHQSFIGEVPADTEAEKESPSAESKQSISVNAPFFRPSEIEGHASETASEFHFQKSDIHPQQQKGKEVDAVQENENEVASLCENVLETETKIETSAGMSAEIFSPAAVTEHHNHPAEESSVYATNILDQEPLPVPNIEEENTTKTLAAAEDVKTTTSLLEEDIKRQLIDEVNIDRSVGDFQERTDGSEAVVFACAQQDEYGVQALGDKIRTLNETEVHANENQVVYEPISSPESNSGGEVYTNIELGGSISVLDIQNTETPLTIGVTNFSTDDVKLGIGQLQQDKEEIPVPDSQALVEMEVQATGETQGPTHAQLEQSNATANVDVSSTDGQSEDTARKIETNAVPEFVGAAEFPKLVREEAGLLDTQTQSEVEITHAASEEYVILEPVLESEIPLDILTQAATESGLSNSPSDGRLAAQEANQDILNGSQNTEIHVATDGAKDTVASSSEVLPKDLLHNALFSTHQTFSGSGDAEMSNSDTLHSTEDANSLVKENAEVNLDLQEVQILQDIEIGREIVVAEEDDEDDDDVKIIKQSEQATEQTTKSGEKVINTYKDEISTTSKEKAKTEDNKKIPEVEKPKKQEMNTQARTKARLAALAEQKAAESKRAAQRQQLNLLALCQEIAEDIATDSMLLKRIEEEKQAAAVAAAAKVEASKRQQPAVTSRDAEADNVATPAGPEGSSVSVTPAPESSVAHPSMAESAETKPAAEPPKRRFFISQISVPLKVHEKKKLTRYQRLRQVELQREKMSWARVKKLKSDQANQMFSDFDWQAPFSGSFLMSPVTTPPPPASSPSTSSPASPAPASKPAPPKPETPKAEPAATEPTKTENSQNHPPKPEAAKTEHVSATEAATDPPAKPEAAKPEVRRSTRQSKAQASQAAAAAPGPAPKVTRSAAKRTLPPVPPPMPNGLKAQKPKPVEYTPYKPRPKYSPDDFELDDDDMLLVASKKPTGPTQAPRPCVPAQRPTPSLKPCTSPQLPNQAKLKAQSAPPGQISATSKPTAAAQHQMKSAPIKPAIVAPQPKPPTAAPSKPNPSVAAAPKANTGALQPQPAAPPSLRSKTAGVNATQPKQRAPTENQPSQSNASAPKANVASAPQKPQNPSTQEDKKPKVTVD